MQHVQAAGRNQYEQSSRVLGYTVSIFGAL